MYATTFPPYRTGSVSASDRQLIDAALLGSQRAHAELVDRYRDRLVTAIRSDVGCEETAEDIAQDAFIRAFTKLHSFRSESGFYTWLFRIALNSRRYYFRNRGRTMPLEEVGESHWRTSPTAETSPPDEIEKREECARVRSALARLDEHHRAILMLREYEGFDYQEISESLHLTMGTVRSRLSRARAQLRKELAGYWAGNPSNSVRPIQKSENSAHRIAMIA